MVSESVSRINVHLEITGKSKISCQLFRHLSPKTVGIISRSMPIQGNAHHIGTSVVYLGTAVDSGIERKRTDFKKGDIAFLPTEGSICFYLDDVFAGKQMTVIGKMMDGVDKLKTVKPSDVLSLSRN